MSTPKEPCWNGEIKKVPEFNLEELLDNILEQQKVFNKIKTPNIGTTDHWIPNPEWDKLGPECDTHPDPYKEIKIGPPPTNTI